MDLNVRAFRTVQAVFAEESAPDKRKEAARKGGLIGGRLRAKLVSSKRRREIATRASQARWNKERSQPKTPSTAVSK